MCGSKPQNATCCEWIMYFITRTYQIVSLYAPGNNAHYEG
jgi:hypothetical protein